RCPGYRQRRLCGVRMGRAWRHRAAVPFRRPRRAATPDGTHRRRRCIDGAARSPCLRALLGRPADSGSPRGGARTPLRRHPARGGLAVQERGTGRLTALPRLTTVIVDYRKAAAVLRGVASLQHQYDPVRLDIVVIDNSTCPSNAARLRELACWPNVTVIV